MWVKCKYQLFVLDYMMCDTFGKPCGSIVLINPYHIQLIITYKQTKLGDINIRYGVVIINTLYKYFSILKTQNFIEDIKNVFKYYYRVLNLFIKCE